MFAFPCKNGTLVKVLIVEDHPIYRDGLAALLESSGVSVVGAAATGTEALAMLDSNPEIVIVDIGLPDVDGADLTAEIIDRQPDAKVLVLTMFRDDSVIGRCLEAGASGYLVKDSPPEEILTAIRAVAGGSLVIGSNIASSARRVVWGEALRDPSPSASSFPELRERERQVVGLVAQGLGNAAIAERLGLSGKTVANYVSAILTRLRLRDRAALAELVKDRTGRS